VLQIVQGALVRNGEKSEATLANVVDALRDIWADANIALAPELSNLRVPDLKLRSTRELGEALEALRVASGYKFQWRKALPNTGSSLTSVGLTVANAPGAWSNGSSDPMFATYLYPFDGGNITVNVTNLPAATYDFYIYGHEATDAGNSTYELAAGGQSYGSLTTGTAPGWNTTVWQEGVQYVRFTNVTVTAGQPVTITVLPGEGGYAVISGLQIARVATSAPVAAREAAGYLIDVQFCALANEGGLNARKRGVAAIGQTTNDFWNAYSRDGTDGSFLIFGALAKLKLACGTVAPATGLPKQPAGESSLYVLAPGIDSQSNPFRRARIAGHNTLDQPGQIDSQANPLRRARRIAEVFNMSGYLDHLPQKDSNEVNRTLEEIKATVLEILDSLKGSNVSDNDRPQFQFHPGTRLLVVTGPPDAIEIARKVVGALTGSPGSFGGGSSPEPDATSAAQEAVVRRYGLRPLGARPPAPAQPAPLNPPPAPASPAEQPR